MTGDTGENVAALLGMAALVLAAGVWLRKQALAGTFRR
jgi:LPXTG-motif cell wall-anchored protein